MLSRINQRKFSGRMERGANAARGSVTEALESRRLLTTAGVVSNVLVVTGTSGAETIEVTQDSGTSQVSVWSGGSLVSGSPFALASFNSIKVNAGANDDTILIASSGNGWNHGNTAVSKPTELHGEAGLDTIQGSDQADTIYGEGDADEIYAQAGNDTVFGGDGADYIEVQAGNNNALRWRRERQHHRRFRQRRAVGRRLRR